MAFKTAHQIFEADPRYQDLCIVQRGATRPLTIQDHHAAIASIVLAGDAPHEVRITFDRARNILLYAWFDYELLIVAEGQAFAAFELALRHRLHKDDVGRVRRLSKLIKEARELGIFSASAPSTAAPVDPIEALRYMRNELAHGTTSVHSPAMALDVVGACASAIDLVFPSDPKAPN